MRPGGAPLGVAVNLSARQLVDPSFPETVAEVLAETGLDATLLNLEVTESVLVEDPDATSRTLSGSRRSASRSRSTTSAPATRRSSTCGASRSTA